MSKDGINSKDFIIGTLIGGIVGATTALFLAPKSGRELRDDLNEQASVVREKTEQLKNTAIEKGTEFAEVAKETTASISQTVSEQSSQVRDKVKNFKNSVDLHEDVIQEDSQDGETVSEVYDEVTIQQTEDIEKKLAETKEAFKEAESHVKQ